MPLPSAEELDRIGNIADPLLCNLEITHAYHRIAVAFAERTGAWVNWCMVAAWASKQAGQTIRGEDMRATLRRHLGVPLSWQTPLDGLWRALLRRGLLNPKSRLGRLVRAIPGPLDAFERTSEAVARGNHKVFVEIGRVFARYLSMPDFAEFLNTLRDGPSPDGQTMLKQAFTHYREGANQGDARRRAELNYLGNLEVAYHEQIRLQDEITRSVEAPAVEAQELGRRVLRVLFPIAARWRPAATVAGWIARPFEHFGRRVARRVVTECMMTIALPGGRMLALGRNLEPRYPECLSSVTSPELLAMMERCGATDGDCGAEDWTLLSDRMPFIARLQRVVFEDPKLTEPPFTAEQVQNFRAGRLPDGSL